MGEFWYAREREGVQIVNVIDQITLSVKEGTSTIKGCNWKNSENLARHPIAFNVLSF